MSNFNVMFDYGIEQEKQKKKDIEALRKMKELETKFEAEREKVIEETPCGIRIKYVKRDGNNG